MARRSEETERLAAQAAARPGDPVARARLAVALAPGEDAARAALEAMTLIRGCLDLGIAEPAAEAAELLQRGFGASEASGVSGLEIALLVADATLQRSGDVARTRALLEAVVAAHPDAVGARLRAAALALGLGEAEAARRWIEPVASADAQTRALYVQTLLALGALDEAVAEALTGLEAAPEASLLHQLLGIAELQRGRTEAAIDALSEGLRLSPDDPVTYYNLALAFEASGSRAAALGVTDAGLELAPSDTRLRALRSRLAAA